MSLCWHDALKPSFDLSLEAFALACYPLLLRRQAAWSADLDVFDGTCVEFALSELIRPAAGRVVTNDLDTLLSWNGSATALIFLSLSFYFFSGVSIIACGLPFVAAWNWRNLEARFRQLVAALVIPPHALQVTEYIYPNTPFGCSWSSTDAPYAGRFWPHLHLGKHGYGTAFSL
jgi:hypothetical protein